MKTRHRTGVVGILPTLDPGVRLVSVVLAQQDDE